jgi:F0F1-type ATP synthase membrane subunit a
MLTIQNIGKFAPYALTILMWVIFSNNTSVFISTACILQCEQWQRICLIYWYVNEVDLHNENEMLCVFRSFIEPDFF